MERGDSAGLSREDGRRFALSVGSAFLVLAGVSLWRGHELAPLILAGPGVLLILAGVLVPGRLGPVYRGWMGMAHAISRVTTPIVMTLIYVVVVVPTGLVLRVFGHDPIRRDGDADGFWIEREDGSRTDMTRQF